MSKLINENEKNLSCQPLTNPYVPNSIDWTQESCYFRNHNSISARPFELNQTPCFENHIDILASYPFPEIEIEHENNPEPQVGNFISLFDSIITLVSLSDFFRVPKSTLNHVPVYREVESPIPYDHNSLLGKVCEH